MLAGVGHEFTVGRRIGSGGYGVVHRAKKHGSGRLVAIKTVRGDIGERADEALSVFRREVSVLSSLDRFKHFPALCCSDISTVDSTYICMELVRGRDLMTIGDNEGFTEVEVLRILAQCCVALGELRRRRLIHRDIKPDNMIMTESGLVKLVDFGLCIREGEDTGKYVYGTPHYVAPEYVQGCPASYKTEIYSLGVTGWLLASGDFPFEGDGSREILKKHIRDRLPPFYGGEVLGSILRRMLKKNPKSRPGAGKVFSEVVCALGKIEGRDELSIVREFLT